MAYRIGDEVIVSCEPASAQVVSVNATHICLQWPWGEIDNSGQVRWDGTFHLPWADSSPEWSPYRFDPAPPALQAGDVCSVSIPPTRLCVGHYEEYAPPRDFGWVPTPAAGIYVVPPESFDPEDVDETVGCMLYLGGAEPHRVESVQD